MAACSIADANVPVGTGLTLEAVQALPDGGEQVQIIHTVPRRLPNLLIPCQQQGHLQKQLLETRFPLKSHRLSSKPQATKPGSSQQSAETSPKTPAHPGKGPRVQKLFGESGAPQAPEQECIAGAMENLHHQILPKLPVFECQMVEIPPSTPRHPGRAQQLQNIFGESGVPPAPKRETETVPEAMEGFLHLDLPWFPGVECQMAETPPSTPRHPGEAQHLQRIFGETGMPPAPKRETALEAMGGRVFPELPPLPTLGCQHS